MGLFYQHDAQKPVKQTRAEMRFAAHVPTLRRLQCQVCTLNHERLQHPKMAPTGPIDADFYVLGEAPGEEEDAQGEQFIGTAGEMLRARIPRNYERRIRWNSTLKCRPPGNRTPLDNEIECCRNFQIADIELVKPKVVLLVGAVALHWAIPVSKVADKPAGIREWRGLFVPSKIGNHVCWTYPMLHPSYINHDGGYESKYYQFFKRDVERAFTIGEQLGAPPYTDPSEYNTGIECTDNYDRISRTLREYAKVPVTTIDLETVGLRPYAGGKIRSCSISAGRDATIAFPTEDPRILALVRWYIINSQRKVAHNLPFELEWFRYFFGHRVIEPAKWGDTLAMAYTLGYKKKMKNLDTLIRIHFGFFLKELSGGIDPSTAPIEDVLPYNGLDAKWTRPLYFALCKQLNESPVKANFWRTVHHLNDLALSVVDAQSQGVPVDLKEIPIQSKIFAAGIKELELKATKTREFAEFEKVYRRAPVLSSPDDMGKLYGQILQAPGVAQDSGRYSTDKEILATLSSRTYPMARILLEHRSMEHTKSSFLDPLKDHVYGDGKLHTSYGHTIVDTERTQSEDPNMQNWPRRRWSVVRKIVKCPPGFKILAMDMGQFEARLLACASGDDAYVRALNVGHDVHGEWADKIYNAYPLVLRRHQIKEWGKEGRDKLRDVCKNGWVFPQFYRSSKYRAYDLMGVPHEIGEELRSEFVTEFRGIFDWHNEQLDFYDRYGYIETLVGFRRYGPFDKFNEPINTPIQGTAARMLNAAWNRCRRAGFRPFLNIHDELSFMVREDVVVETADAIAPIMCDVSMYNFIRVPIIVEAAVHDADWSTKIKFKVYSSKDYS